MEPDRVSVRVHLRRIRVVAVLVDVIEKLVVEVADVRRVVRCASSPASPDLRATRRTTAGPDLRRRRPHVLADRAPSFAGGIGRSDSRR